MAELGLFSQVEAYALRELSPSTGTSFSLEFKIALAIASVVAYTVLTQAGEALEASGRIPHAGRWFHYLVGASFGSLVLAPYVRAPHRLLRGVALAAAGALIYYLAVRFVVDSPIGADAITSFVLAGAGAAVLAGAAVVLIAPQAYGARLFLLALLAGAAGGAAFDLKLAFDPSLVAGHAAWQALVCLALHFGLRPAPT